MTTHCSSVLCLCNLSQSHWACIPDGKVHHSVQLVPPTAVVRETLQVNDQNARQRPQVELLGGLLVFLARWAIPARAKDFFLFFFYEGRDESLERQ